MRKTTMKRNARLTLTVLVLGLLLVNGCDGDGGG